MSDNIFETSSGYKLKLKKISPRLFVAMRESFPPPEPPLNQVTDLDGKTIQEPNLADPNYQKALQNYESLLNEKIQKLIVLRGVECEIDDIAVEELRKDWKSLGVEKDLPEDNKELFILFIALASVEDYESLVEKVLQRSMPTQATTEAAQQAFKS